MVEALALNTALKSDLPENQYETIISVELEVYGPALSSLRALVLL
jgi:hypothetical protein